jgi:hypothetical protein
MTTKTANNKYDLETIYFSESLKDHVQNCYAKICQIFGWKLKKICQKEFVYDNIASSLAYTFEQIKFSSTKEEIIKLVVDSSTENYLFWNKYEPWRTNKNFNKPPKTINPRQKEILSYFDLSINERARIISCYISHSITISKDKRSE